MKSKLVIAIAIGLGMACVLPAHAAPEKVPVVEEKTVIGFPEGKKGIPAYLKAMKAQYEDPPAAVGTLQKGWLCAPSGKIFWKSSVFRLASAHWAGVFRKELKNAHYPVPESQDSIFDEPQGKQKSDDALQVGVLVKEVKASLCLNSDNTEGGVYMKLFWQVFSPASQKVIFETTTEGSYQPQAAEKVMAPAFFEKAFAVAARNLFADPGFSRAVADGSGSVAKAEGLELLKLKRAQLSHESLTKNITAIRSAVATVLSDTGSGTGFFVSKDGYLLTNYHVVKPARFVKVRLATGRDLVGEVVRFDKTRDVALVKTESIDIQPVSLRVDEPNVGDEVYAIGSPLGDKFNTTLTHGVLSGYRTLAENRYLQSDVAILPGNSGGPLLDDKGNVVGITAMGLGAKGVAGMNFFIPIGDALAKLSIAPK